MAVLRCTAPPERAALGVTGSPQIEPLLNELSVMVELLVE